ncbi:MAG: hypothetical protein P8L66_07295 [Rhodospirillaceae bacterium]|nr:hypothetical protein [Rhodospirillaceae bacterium]
MSSNQNSFLTKARVLGLRHSHLAGGLLLSALLGVVIALLSSNSVQQRASRDANWSLPIENALILESDIDTMLAEPLFGGTPVIKAISDAVVEGEEFTEWSLLGIIAEGNQRQIVFKNVETGEIQHARAGETLPSGETLMEIYDNSIALQKDNESRTIALFEDIER